MIPTKDLTQYLKKYNISGPRYTSYPTAPHFNKNIGFKEWNIAIEKSNNKSQDISIYIHIPFCHSLCYFCGCNMQVTKNANKVENYLAHLAKEISIISSQLDKSKKVKQIHFGGGTPNFLTPNQIINLGNTIRKYFDFDKKIEYSCELDPRQLTQDHIKSLKKIGVNRVSIGIQDFDELVQIKINRKNKVSQIQTVLKWLKNEGITSYNFDLIYGLPLQHISSFDNTLNEIINLNPSRIACYNFAYLPQLKPHHKLIKKSDLPSASQRIQLLIHTIEKLQSNGYTYIGMDHFAKNDDSLVKAQLSGNLQRNFQGYSTHKKTELFAFGTSSISNFGDAFFQNQKLLPNYFTQIDADKIPLEKGIVLSRQDLIIQDVISSLMCNLKLDFNKFNLKHNINFECFFEQELVKLNELFIEDDFINIQNNMLIITEIGRLFIRNIVMVFDKYLNKNNSFYSKTV